MKNTKFFKFGDIKTIVKFWICEVTKPKLFPNHEAEVEAEALSFWNHEAEAEAASYPCAPLFQDLDLDFLILLLRTPV